MKTPSSKEKDILDCKLTKKQLETGVYEFYNPITGAVLAIKDLNIDQLRAALYKSLKSGDKMSRALEKLATISERAFMES